MIKQVIVIRKDLHMRRGKEISQACHASMKVFFDRGNIELYNVTPGPVGSLKIPLTPQMKEWVEGIFTKIIIEQFGGKCYLTQEEMMEWRVKNL